MTGVGRVEGGQRGNGLGRQGLGHCTPKKPECERMRGSEFSPIEHHLPGGRWNPRSPLTLIQVFLSLPSPRAQPVLGYQHRSERPFFWALCASGEGGVWGDQLPSGRADTGQGGHWVCWVGGWEASMGNGWVLTAFSCLLHSYCLRFLDAVEPKRGH